MIITKDMLNKKVPSEMFPTRLDSALNLYTYVDDGLIVYNINPTTWNCLYPFFELNHKFTVDEYEFSNRNMTYGELISEYQSQYKAIYEGERGIDKDMRKRILIDAYEKTFDVSGSTITDELESVYELKYSKSKDVWTLYYFENYVVGKIDDVDALLKQKAYSQKFMPLDANVSEVDGVEVVSNLPYILSDERNIQVLKKNKIERE